MYSLSRASGRSDGKFGTKGDHKLGEHEPRVLIYCHIIIHSYLRISIYYYTVQCVIVLIH